MKVTLETTPSPCLLPVQDFAGELDVMPSIVMENNVIHNNEGYGVILVKPSDQEEQKTQEPSDKAEGR